MKPPTNGPVMTASLRYLRSLRGRYDFAVVNCGNIHACGGNDTDWANATHVDRFDVQRMLRYIVAHSGSTNPGTR